MLYLDFKTKKKTMKNLFYLSLICVFIACGGASEEASTEAAPAVAAPEVIVADLGCKTDGGGECLADHSCCAVSEETEATEDATEEVND